MSERLIFPVPPITPDLNLNGNLNPNRAPPEARWD